MHGVFDAGLLFLHFGLGGRADLDHGHAADQLRQPLLQLFAVVVRGGVLDLRAQLFHATLDGGRRAGAFDDGRVVLVDGDLLGLAQILQLDGLELDPEVLGDGAALVRMAMSSSMALRRSPKPGALTAAALQRAAELVDDERRQRFTFDVLRDDEQRPAEARHLLEQRQKVFHRADLLFVNQDQRILQHYFHALGVGDEVGRQVAAVELHALDDFERRVEALGLLRP